MHCILPSVLTLLTLAAPAGNQAPGETQLLVPVAEIPMNLSTQHVGVEVWLADQGPFTFNLDTYAVTSACVDQAFAQRMGLAKVGTARNGDGSGASRLRDIVLIPELRFGDALFTNVQALVDDYSWVADSEGGSIDGLLGYHLFRELLLELDYPEQRVMLSRGELSAQEPHVISHPALRTRPDIPLHIGEQRLIVGIDSGAQSGLSCPSSLLESLQLASEPVVVGRAKTVYSEADILTAALAERLLLAGHPHDGAVATFSEIFGMPLLGHELLVEYSVTFDQKNGRVRFRKAPAPENQAQGRSDRPDAPTPDK